MNRSLFLILIFVVLIISFVFMKAWKDSYQLLPGDLNTPPTVTAFEDWKEFTSDKGDFKAQFPLLPQKASENAKDPKTNQIRKYDMFVAEKSNGTIMMISLITFPPDQNMTNPEDLLEKMMRELIDSSADNKLIQMKKGVFQGYPSLDFSFQNKDSRIDDKGFIMDHTLYLLTSIAKNELYDEKEFQHFVDSFQLLK